MEVDVSGAKLSRLARGRCAGQSLRARFPGARPGSPPAYARLVRDVDWGEGDLVLYGVSMRLSRGFHRRLQGQVALLRWDNFPAGGRADYSGVVIDRQDRLARLVLQRHGSEPDRPLTGAFALPEGRWFRLSVRQRLSPGCAAYNEVSVDGTTVARSEVPNMRPGQPEVERVRFGLAAIARSQRRGLTLSFSGPDAAPAPGREGPDAGL